MSQRKELKIVISKTGEVTVEVIGSTGSGCLDETKFLEHALGNTVKDRQLTAEFHNNTETKEEETCTN